MQQEITVSLKVEIVKASQASRNVKQTSCKYGVESSQTRQWRGNIQGSTHMSLLKPNNINVHKGKPLENAELEDAVYEWVM